MLPVYLEAFNNALLEFQTKFPKEKWSADFKQSLLNDYTFFSARIEDPKLTYGDTIRFLNDESVRAINIDSLVAVSQHQLVLKSLIEQLDNFTLEEEVVKSIHASLMDTPLAWDADFKPELVGQYRNIPTVGLRDPYFTDKEYAPHYNLPIIVPSFLDLVASKMADIDNLIEEKHLITRLAAFHNTFLNEIHPFADGNGRVCRIIMGAIMMSNNCPPVFPKIIEHKDQLEYITTIVECEAAKSNIPLVKYLCVGMTNYINQRLADG